MAKGGLVRCGPFTLAVLALAAIVEIARNRGLVRCGLVLLAPSAILVLGWPIVWLAFACWLVFQVLRIASRCAGCASPLQWRNGWVCSHCRIDGKPLFIRLACCPLAVLVARSTIGFPDAWWHAVAWILVTLTAVIWRGRALCLSCDSRFALRGRNVCLDCVERDPVWRGSRRVEPLVRGGGGGGGGGASETGSAAAADDCAICWDRASAVVLIPCGHLCACEQCARKVTACPICRTAISQNIRVFKCLPRVTGAICSTPLSPEQRRRRRRRWRCRAPERYGYYGHCCRCFPVSSPVRLQCTPSICTCLAW